MNVVFWNIDKLTAQALATYAQLLVDEHAPAIICLAEGYPSHDNLHDLIACFAGLGYSCYYSPVAYLSDASLPPSWHPSGLKVFVRHNQSLAAAFDFTRIRRKGRLVVVKPQLPAPASPTAIVFVHGKAKSGGKAWTAAQANFLKDLKILLEESGQIKPGERVVLIGDFNLEPWDELMRHEEYFLTCFTPKQRQVAQQHPKALPVLYNPVLEAIWNSSEPNLVGTYYSNKAGWALFDYVLYDVKETGINYEIVTSLHDDPDPVKLLETATLGVYRNFFAAGIDHLPILVQLT
jgi:exonuclease III